MTFKDAVIAISARLAAGFTALPLLLDPSLEVTPPAEGYVEMFTSWGEEQQQAFGSATPPWEGNASTDLGIYVPANQGDGLAWDYVVAISALFRGLTIVVAGGTIEFKGTRPEVPAQVKGGPYYQLNLILTFEFRSPLAIAV